MANEIIFPYISPLRFTKMEVTQVANYVSRFMDDYRFRDTIKSYEQPVCFPQPWMQVDTIPLQFISNYGPLNISAFDIDGNQIVAPQAFTTGQQDFFRPGYYIRSITLDLTGLEGYLYWQLSVGGSTVWVSEPQEIRDIWPNTLYAQYKHYERYGGVIFETGYEGAIRIPAVLKWKAPGAKDTIYEDQPLNQTMIKSDPFRLWDLIIGDAKGVPPWMPDIMIWILGCSDMRLDGKYYTKSTDAELEINEADNVAMAGYRIELREKIRRDGIIYTDDTALQGYGSMMAVIDTKGFGLEGDFVPINDVQ